MIKPVILALSCATAGAVVSTLFVGRTEYSSSLRASIPFGSSVKVTPDPGSIWSWHHTFTNVDPSAPQSADVLVDINGDQAMDTSNAWLRVIVTDLQIVSLQGISSGIVRIVDSQGRRLAASIGGAQASGHVHHVNLTTPIVLPVGSSLRVELECTSTRSNFEVNMIGRVVNL